MRTELLNLCGDLLPAMLRILWQGGIALAAVWIVCRVFRRMPGRVKCWLWRLGYLKLILSLLWAVPVELHVLRAASPLVVEAAPVVYHVMPFRGPTLVAPDVVPEPSPIPQWNMRDVITLGAVGVWMLGTSVLLLRFAVQWRAAIGLRRDARPLWRSEIQATCDTLAARYGLRRRVPVFQARSVGVPLLVGVFRPAILLPVELNGDVRLILAHELAHAARRDLFWNLLCTVAESICFFQPLLWLARREMRLAMEMACDEAAMGMTQASPREYGQTLLAAVAKWPSSVLAAGVVQSKRNLERRLLAMQHSNTWSRRRLWAAGFVLAIFGMASLPSWRLAAQTTTQPGGAPAASNLSPNKFVVTALNGATLESGTVMIVNDGTPTTQPGTGTLVIFDDTNRIDDLKSSAALVQDQVVQKLEALRQRELELGNNNPSVREEQAEVNNLQNRLSVLREQMAAEQVRTAEAAAKRYSVQTLADGVIMTVNIPDNGQMRKGDVLFQLDNRRAKLALEESAIKLKYAQRQLERYKQDPTAVSAQDLDGAQYAVDLAQIDVQEKQLDVDDTMIRAPVEGTVRPGALHVGQQVKRGQTLLEIEGR